MAKYRREGVESCPPKRCVVGCAQGRSEHPDGRRGDYKPVPGIEDVSVPQEQLAEYLQNVLDFCGEQEDVPGIAVYAHASAGCLHVRPLLNLKNRTGIDTLRTVGEHACDLAGQLRRRDERRNTATALARGYLHPRPVSGRNSTAQCGR